MKRLRDLCQHRHKWSTFGPLYVLNKHFFNFIFFKQTLVGNIKKKFKKKFLDNFFV